MSERGVIYIVWGRNDRTERALERSRRSIKALHPELPIEIFRLDVDDPIKGLLHKSRMFELSPFHETLYLDADTVVLDRLDFAFVKAQEFGLACCICECPWARRYGGIQGEMVEYNTGVLFFSKQARPVFERWSQLAPKIDSSIIFLGSGGQKHRMEHNDQCSFAAAIEQTKFLPFVLPLNWNFRPIWQLSFFGPIKIWHDYGELPPFFAEMRKYYEQPEAIIQYHRAIPMR
jgi:hypothetical protein